MAVRTVAQLAERVRSDPALKQEIQEDPVAALSRVAYTADPTFYRVAIGGLIGIIAFVILSSVVVQISTDEVIPDWLAALATTALGGLVGLFAPSPSEK